MSTCPSFTAATTSSCWDSVNSGYSGSASVSREASSAWGKSPSLYPNFWQGMERCGANKESVSTLAPTSKNTLCGFMKLSIQATVSSSFWQARAKKTDLRIGINENGPFRVIYSTCRIHCLFYFRKSSCGGKEQLRAKEVVEEICKK